ncbi:MAG: right-handed parallel beta-helix repeat-containing protein, partial [Mycobacterium sp.]|nr:right-handed parallel beta-helix repeat-containing protein [Mycobacterium sp.]
MSIRTAFSWARPRAWRIVSLVSVLLVGMLLAAPAAHAAGITYYVSAAGDDANSGTSTSAPWRSLSKINNTVFGPGDQILLRSGDVWSGGITMRSAGSDGNPITIGAYGSGNKPLINGGGTVQGAVQIIDVSNIVVDGLALTNYTGASVYDDPECNCDGIKILGFGAATDNLTIRNNEVYNVEGFSNNASIGPPRGTTLDPSQNNLYTSGAIYQGGTAHNVTIENNYIHDNSNDGMQLTTVSSGLVIRNNMVNNTGADGITYENTTSPLIEHNSVIGAGNNSGTATLGPGEIGGNGAAVAGLWGAFHTGQVAQFNYVEGTKRILWDGQAWDFDNGTSNGVYQYNFSRDNDGGFALGGNDSEVYRYN